jgi:hypothetical protein
MAGPMQEDKRRFPRVDFTSSLDVYPVIPSKSGFIFEVAPRHESMKAKDISQSGIRLATPQPIAYRSILKLRMELRKKQPVELFARVIWSENGQSGLKFIVLHEEAKRHLAQYTGAPLSQDL